MVATSTAPRIGAFFMQTNTYRQKIGQVRAIPAILARKNVKIVLIGIVIAILLLIAGAKITSKPVSQVKDQRIVVTGAKAQKNINKEFSFPIKDNKGKTITTLKITLEKAELRDEIIVKGQKAYPVQGKTFLILDMRIKNDLDKAIELKARDYFRLVINNKEEDKLAADIHNDPVSIQPLSTKQTRIGFFISDTDKNLSLYVGELTGKKTKVPISF